MLLSWQKSGLWSVTCSMLVLTGRLWHIDSPLGCGAVYAWSGMLAEQELALGGLYAAQVQQPVNAVSA